MELEREKRMEDQDYLQLFFQSANPLREMTVQSLLEQNVDYQEACRCEHEAEQQYLSLPLDQEQRRVVEAFLRRRERSCLLYADATYIAGIKNFIWLQRLMTKPL